METPAWNGVAIVAGWGGNFLSALAHQIDVPRYDAVPANFKIRNPCWRPLTFSLTLSSGTVHPKRRSLECVIHFLINSGVSISVSVPVLSRRFKSSLASAVLVKWDGLSWSGKHGRRPRSGNLSWYCKAHVNARAPWIVIRFGGALLDHAINVPLEDVVSRPSFTYTWIHELFLLVDVVKIRKNISL